MVNSTTYSTPGYQELIHKKWENFINDIEDDYSMVRPEVLTSWSRSRSAGVDPHKLIHTLLSPEALSIKLSLNAELMSICRPYMERMYNIVKGSGAYILLSDREGYILDVIGDPDIVYQGQSYSLLVVGACRSESMAGTNAVGTTLYLNTPIQFWGEEHYIEWHKAYACAGAPFYDVNDNLLGSITVTCKKAYAHPHTLGMVSCAADSITREVKLKAAMDKLELLNSQRNMIIENMTAGVFLLSPTGRISQVNTVALTMLGLTYANTLGKQFFDIISIDYLTNSECKQDFMSKECYNLEVNLSIASQPTQSKKINLSINHIKNSADELTGILVRVNKPEVIQKLVKRIEGYHAKYSFNDIIGESEPMQQLKRACMKAAQSDSNVLILGESGTGKELIAQSIHNASPVSRGPFVAINCASIPNNLVESELFGYERGAFTGAAKEGRPGKFELADGGTIFLDEIGDMPLDVQATLLRVIQTREVTRIGSNSPRPINIRIIAATNQNLNQAIQDKTFRSDLYYRLNVFTIQPPALRDRGPEDIKRLADFFVNSYNRNKGTNFEILPNVYPYLQSYRWPGNVRQLENVMERAINLTDEGYIGPEHMPDYILRKDPQPQMQGYPQSYAQGYAQSYAQHVPPQPALPYVMPDTPHTTPQAPVATDNMDRMPSREDSEKSLIISALIRTSGRITDTADLLSMNRRTLYRRMDKLGIDPAQYRRRR